jgi:thiol-disulfide isomerase/thioredoxin
MLAGSLAALLIAGCGGQEQPASSASSKYQPAAVSGEKVAAAETNTSDDATNQPAANQPATSPAGVAKSNQPAAAPEDSAAIKQPAPIPVDKLDAESMPQGPPAAILAYMRQLDGYNPRGVTREAQLADLIRVMHLVTEAGERVLQHPDATEEQRRDAASLKLMALHKLTQFGEPKADQELVAYALRLKKDAAPSVARVGRVMLFSLDLAKLQNGDIDDPAPLLEELKYLIANGPDEDHIVFMLGNQAALTFTQLAKNEAAAEAYTLLGNAYKDDPDANVREQAGQLLKQVRLVELDFRGKLTALFDKEPKPDAAAQVVAAVNSLLADPNPGEMELSVASQSADILERTGHYTEARTLLTSLGEKFGASENPEIAAEVKEIVESGKKRLALIGQPLPLAGVTLDGQPFDVSTLKGKIVLVDFWATWCGPCLEEIPNIKQVYEQYHAKGFEVVGYNIDDERATVEQFFTNQKLPWPTVMSADPDKVGFDSPLAQFCGVKSIPFLVLLDGEGKVIALHTRGERLGEKIAELLGPVEAAQKTGSVNRQLK